MFGGDVWNKVFLPRLKSDPAQAEPAEGPKLRLWFNGTDTYVAESAEHARALMVTHMGGDGDDVPPLDDWSEDTREVLTIGDDDAGTQTKSAQVWCRENGPGFLCSTEW